MLKGKIFYFDEPLTAYMSRHYSTEFPKGKEVKVLAIKLHIGCNSGLAVRIEGLTEPFREKRDAWFDASWVTTKKRKNKYESDNGGTG
jgi:hypothetical protein